MPNPQQPELRRNDKGPATDQDQRRQKLSGEPAAQDEAGTGGPTPPDQQTVDERISPKS